jgi:hypothetical protein
MICRGCISLIADFGSTCVQDSGLLKKSAVEVRSAFLYTSVAQFESVMTGTFMSDLCTCETGYNWREGF